MLRADCVLCELIPTLLHDKVLVHDICLAACILHPYLPELHCVNVRRRDSYKSRREIRVPKFYVQMSGKMGSSTSDIR